MTAVPIVDGSAIGSRVVLLACGHRDRGDDAVAAIAVAGLATEARALVAIEVCDALQPESLTRVASDASVVIVDAVAGPPAGQVIEIDLADMGAMTRQTLVASSHQLPLARLVGLAGILRGRPLEGIFLGVGVADVSLGAGLSAAVETSLPLLTRAIEDAVLRLAGRFDDGARQTPCADRPALAVRPA